MSDTRFGSWSVAESPFTIEYSLVVIEEIRREVAEGFQKLSRGGVEVGGMLYGSREGRTIRITAMRPIACEHARGPAFLLSDGDKELLKEQLQHELEDPRLEGKVCLGWFISHTRSEIALAESDQEIYAKHFSAPWQVTLVIRPGRGGSMRAGFFAREHDGTVRSASSYLEFNFPDRLAGVLGPPPDRLPLERLPQDRLPLERLPRGPMADRRPPAGFLHEGGPAVARREIAPPPAGPAPSPKLLPAGPARAKWSWLMVWAAVVLGLLILGLRYYLLTPRVDPLALTLVEHDGQLQIEWNHSARPVTSAVRGSLAIVDGKLPSTYPLTPQDLEHGSFTYQRISDYVEVRMSVENANGGVIRETSTFLGSAAASGSAPASGAAPASGTAPASGAAPALGAAPSSSAAPGQADAGEKAKADQERAGLQAEIDRLRRANAGQADRIRELERNLSVLQSRLGAQQDPQ